jgi:hypothetical protein
MMPIRLRYTSTCNYMDPATRDCLQPPPHMSLQVFADWEIRDRGAAEKPRCPYYALTCSAAIMTMSLYTSGTRN